MNSKPFFKLLLSVGLSFLLVNVVAAQEPSNIEAKDKPTKKMIRLQPGTAEPNAGGMADIMLKTGRNEMQKFQVVCERLSGGTYFLYVDGLLIDTAATSNQVGSGIEWMFVKKSKGKIGAGQKPLPPALDPVTKIKHIEIRNVSNQIVLSGNFQ